MSDIVRRAAALPKGRTVAPRATREDKSLALPVNGQDSALDLPADAEGDDLVRRLLREAINEARQSNPDWAKDSAVAEAIGLKGENGAAYFSKMLSGEKPIGSKHLRALPDDIEAIYARLYAEAFGHIVVAPVRGEAAVRNLVSGLFGVLLPRAVDQRLPSHSGGQLKAALPYAGAERRRA